MLAAAITAIALALGAGAVARFPAAPALARATAHVRCLMSDSPMSLIRLNALSRGLANGCPNWVDVTGRTYGPDRPRHGESRAHNVRWQHDLTTYLRSGDAARHRAAHRHRHRPDHAPSAGPRRRAGPLARRHGLPRDRAPSLTSRPYRPP